MAEEASVLPHLVTGAGAVVVGVLGLLGVGRKQAVTIGTLREEFRQMKARVAAFEADPDGMPQMRLRVKALEERRMSAERVRRMIESTLSEKVREMKEQVEDARELAAGALPRAEYARAVDGDGEKWEEMNRMLGRLEGSIQGLRDQIQGGSPRR